MAIVVINIVDIFTDTINMNIVAVTVTIIIINILSIVIDTTSRGVGLMYV